jgi:hypothetical protein
MAQAKLQYNPDRSLYGGELPDGTGFLEEYDDDAEYAIIDGPDGVQFLAAFDDPPDGLQPNTVYQLTPIETVLEEDVEFEDEDEGEDENEGEEEAEPAAE